LGGGRGLFVLFENNYMDQTIWFSMLPSMAALIDGAGRIGQLYLC